jgi:uncharacterized protein (TIGR04255 family)
VNRLDIPRGDRVTIPTEDYLLIEPQIPEIIPSLRFFTTQFIGIVPEIEGQVIVNAGTVPSPLIDHLSLLLDIDLFKEQTLPQRDTDVWELLEVLRKRKNIIFESFITDSARELFDNA